MANGFKILVHRNDENAHFKLIGDFDDKAASELIDTLRIYSGSLSKIFIHTDSLNEIIDYDEQDFKNRFNNSANVPSAKILSTGRYCRIFATLKGKSFQL
jgi:hypothetical protein